MIQENEILVSVNGDPLFFRFVNCARIPPPPPPLYHPLHWGVTVMAHKTCLRALDIMG